MTFARASDPACRRVLRQDMDAFFASVAELSDPSLRGKPLVVCHSASARGTGEVSSANYAARSHGVRAGCFISEAKRLCPGLIVMPYEFDKYIEVSEQVGASTRALGPRFATPRQCVLLGLPA
jgi:DNA repair protein REV1